MRTILMSAVLVALAAPAIADDKQAPGDERLGQLEQVTITAIKEQPADERLDQLEYVRFTAIKEEPAAERLKALEQVTLTAGKEQPADYKPDAKTLALLAEIAADDE